MHWRGCGPTLASIRCSRKFKITATLQNCLASSYKVKHTLIPASSSAPSYLLKSSKNKYLPNSSYSHMHRSFISKVPNWKELKCPLSDTCICKIYYIPYTEIFLNCTKKWTADIFNTMYVSENYLYWVKSETQKALHCLIPFKMHWRKREHLWGDKMYSVVLIVLVIQLYTCLSKHIIQFKFGKFCCK